MRSRSTYTKSFTGQPGKRSEWGKVPDNLRTGSNWYGSTTYGNNFRQPNPEDYAHKYSNIEKYNKDPNYNRQYGKFIVIQKLLMGTASQESNRESAQPRSSLKQNLKDSSPIQKIISHKMQIISPQIQAFMQFPPQNTTSFDFLLYPI